MPSHDASHDSLTTFVPLLAVLLMATLVALAVRTVDRGPGAEQATTVLPFGG